MHKPNRMLDMITSGILTLSLTHALYANADEGHPAKNRCHHSKHSVHEGGNFAKNHGGLPPFLKDISLSATQKTQIKTIVEALQPNMKSHLQQRHALMAQMISNPNPEVFDEKKAENIANQMAALEKEAFLNRAKTGSQIFALLTPEQRKQATENIKKQEDKMHELKAEPANFKNTKESFLQRIKG